MPSPNAPSSVLLFLLLSALVLGAASAPPAYAQGPTCARVPDPARSIPNPSLTAATVGEVVGVRVAGIYAPTGGQAAALELHAGRREDFVPSAATLVESRPLTPLYGAPRIANLGSLRHGCPSPAGGPDYGGAENEFTVLWSGSGGIVVDSLSVETPLGTNDDCAACSSPGTPSCAWLPGAQVKRARPGPCDVNYVGPGDSIPPMAMVVVVYSSAMTIGLDLGPLCREGDRVYVLQASCSRLVGGVAREAVPQAHDLPIDQLRITVNHGDGFSAGYVLAGLASNPGHYYGATLAPGPHDRMDCATGRVVALEVRAYLREQGRFGEGGTYAFDYAVREGDCGALYFKAVVVTPDGSCGPRVVTAASRPLAVACPAVELAGALVGCPGDDAGAVDVVANTLTRALPLELRIHQGAWFRVVVRPGDTRVDLGHVLTAAEVGPPGASVAIGVRVAADYGGPLPDVTTSVSSTVGEGCAPPCVPQQVTITGEVQACPGQSIPALDVALSDVAAFALLEYRVGGGAWRTLPIPATATTVALDYVPTAADDGADLALEFRVSPSDPACETQLDARVRVTVGGAACAPDCSPPDPGRFGPTVTGFCDPTRFDGTALPYNRGGDRAGYERVFVVLDASPERDVLAVFRDGLPTWAEVFAAAGGADAFILIARSRSLTDPACLRDSPDYTLRRERRRETVPRTIALCPGEVVELPDGSTVSEARRTGEYVVDGPTACSDTLFTVTTTLAEAPTDSRPVGACGAASFTLPDGRVVDVSDPVATYRAPGPAGTCDTLVTVTFDPPSAPTDERTVTRCAGGSFVLPDGIRLDADRPTGTYLAPAPDGGCDSVVTVTLALLPPLARTVPYPLCAGETVTLPDGTVLDEENPTATYFAFGTNGACDTTVTAVATFGPPPTRPVTVPVCAGGTYALPDGTVLDAANPTGSYTVAVEGGCDSVIAVALDFAALLTDTRTFGVCGDVGALLPDGTVLAAARPTAQYVAPGPPGGCDTLVTAVFGGGEAPTRPVAVEVCAGGSYTLPDGTVLDAATPAGSYSVAVPDGCDSVIAVTLDFLPPLTRTDPYALCAGGAVTLHTGAVLDEDRPVLTYVAPGLDGACDTTVTAAATFSDQLTDTRTVGACGDVEYVLPNGLRLSASVPEGSYVAPGPAGACDTLITVTFDPPAAPTDTRTVTRCAGGSLTLPDGTVLDAVRPTGTYTAPAPGGGCDSVVAVALELSEALARSDPYRLCAGGSVTLAGGIILDAANPTATYTATGVGGACDTLVTAVFVGLPLPARDTTVRLCPGQRFFLPDGSFLDTGRPSGTYRKPTTVAGACDTLVTYRADFARFLTAEREFGACAGVTVTLPDGVTVLSADAPVATYLADGRAGACDTLVSARLVEGAPVVEERVERAICPGEVVTVGGEGFGESRLTGVVTLPNASGCDSVRYVIALTVSAPPPPARDTVFVIQGEEVTLGPRADVEVADVRWDSSLLSCRDCETPTLVAFESGAFTYAYTSAAGCLLRDAVYVLVVEEPIAEPSGRRRILAPNAFSPNGDGVNDVFLPRLRETDVVVLRWEIYDRWGGRLFSRGDFAADDERGGWDGESDGEPLDAGVYIWVARARWPDGTEAEAAGEVTLMR